MKSYSKISQKSKKTHDIMQGAPKIPEILGGFAFIDELSARDITKHQKIRKLNFIYSLNILLYRKYSQDIYDYIDNQNQKKYRNK